MAKSKKTASLTADILTLVEKSLDDDKAQDIVVIDLAGRTALADAMIIATGTSQRHVSALAEHLREKLKAIGVQGVTVEGQAQGDWVLIDSGDVLVHLFRPEVRDYYQLEKLWTVRPPKAEPPTASA